MKIRSESIRIVTSKCMKWKCQDWKKGYQSPLICANHLYKLEATSMSEPIVSLSFTICWFLCHYVSLYFCLFYFVPSSSLCTVPLAKCTLSGLPYPHLRVRGTDLWARCCITMHRPNPARNPPGKLSPTSTLAHRLVVIYWASSRLARSPKFPSHNTRRPSHSAPHTRPTVCRMASNWC